MHVFLTCLYHEMVFLLEPLVEGKHVRGRETSVLRIADASVNAVTQSHNRLIAIEEFPALRTVTHTGGITERESFEEGIGKASVCLQGTYLAVVFFFGGIDQRILHHISRFVYQQRVTPCQQFLIASLNTDSRAVLQDLSHLVETRVGRASVLGRTVSGNACAPDVTLVELETGVHTQLITYLSVYIQGQVVPFASAIHHRAFVFIVAVCHAVLDAVASTVHAYTVVLRNGSAAHGQVLPVQSTVGIIFVYFQKTSIKVLPGRHLHSRVGSPPYRTFVIGKYELFGTEQFQLLGKFAHAHVCVKCYGSLPSVVLSTLSRNQYNTVRTPCTIDSGGRSVFQDIDAFNVGRVKARISVLGRETVNHIQRLVALRDGNTATHTDGSLGTRLAVGLYHLHTCHTSGYRLRQIRYRCLGQFFTLYRSHRAGQVFALHRGISYYDYFFQQLVIRLKRDIDLLLPLYRNFLRLHADIRKYQYGFRRIAYLNGVLTGHVRNGTGRCAFHRDVSANHFQSFIVGHFTGHRNALCPCARHSYKEKEHTE